MKLFDGLVHVMGEPDTGKTTFALTCGVPVEKIAFFDHDIKGSVLVSQIGSSKFGAYHNLVALHKGLTEIPFFDACMKLVDSIPKDTECIVWDNWAPFEDTHYPKVMQDASKYRTTWATMGAIKGAQQWDASFQLTGEILSTLLGKAPLVFIISHLKQQNLAGVRTEKWIPAVKRVVPQKANFRVWLRMNPNGKGAPVGLVLKRIGKPIIKEDGSLQIVNVLPRRIDPCTWENIRKYWDNPVGDRENEKLEKSEIPDDFELSILDGTLTKEQRKSFELMLQYGVKDEEEAALQAAGDKADAIKAYKEANPEATPAEIRANVEGADALTIPAILKILSG